MLAGTGLIDLHCHLLPGVDDGALDVDDSVAMARVAVKEGFEAICATPHIRHDHDVRIAEIAGRVAALGEELERRGIALRVLPGGEVAETVVGALTDAELRALALGGGRWILLEPRAGPLSDSLDDAAAQLRARGFHALIAHPERHLAEDLFARLERLVTAGALVQATAAFFERPPTAEGMLALARRGLVHVLASDAHSSHGGRPVALGGALDALAGVELLAPHLDWIAHTAPAAIVAGAVPRPPYAPG
ncbi:MAG TPA: CpsB/CapC family capsule biosynthesis tyrosine phosphatase [Solirubrobacteraceae bacterium]